MRFTALGSGSDISSSGVVGLGELVRVSFKGLSSEFDIFSDGVVVVGGEVVRVRFNGLSSETDILRTDVPREYAISLSL